MTRQPFVSTVAALLCIGLASHCMAEGRFNMRSLNPFAKKEASRSIGSVSDQQNNRLLPKFQMPKMEMPKLKMPRLTPERKPNEPGAVQRISQSTQGVLTKTRDTLMPWAKPKKQAKPRRRGITITPKEPKKSFLGNLFGTPEATELPGTPNEFLSLPKPE